MFTDISWIDAILRGMFCALIGLVWVIMLIRIVGLRSFSKMTSFDFVMTVATGSLLAAITQSTDWVELIQPCSAIAALFALQFTVAKLRKSSVAFERVIQNTPVLLMKDGEILQAAMDFTRVEVGDLMAKLREANISKLSDVKAVVLETTGDISVITGDPPADMILEAVKTI